MNLPDRYDGPRLMRPEEAQACERLSKICFGDFSGPNQDGEAQEPGPVESAPVEEPAPQAEAEAQENSELHVIACDGQPVSQIYIVQTPLRVYGSVIGVGSIGGVCTLPEERGNGLATVLLEHCAKRLVEMGASLMLISGGRGLYTRSGNVPAGCYANFQIKAVSPQNQSGHGGYSLRPAAVGDALAAARLYQAEPVHFSRPLDRYSEYFSTPSGGWHSERWIVERDARPVAYLVFGTPWEFITRPELKMRFVHEYAGSRAGLAEAVGMAMAQGGLQGLTFDVPGQDSELIDLLERRYGPPAWTTLEGHTERILDFGALMAGLGDYQRARLPDALRRGLRFSQSGGIIINGDEHADPGQCVIERGPDRLALDTASMTRLVMGDPQGLMLVDAPGALREIIAALFPLPAFMPGMDYH